MSPATVAIPAKDPELRKTGIGGSDAAAILGLSKWKSPLDVYMEKRGLVEAEERSEAAEWGEILEPVVISEFCGRQKVTVVARDRAGLISVFYPDGVVQPFDDPEKTPLSIPETLVWTLMQTLRHPEADFMMCHLDGVIIGDDWKPIGILEAKTSSAFRGKEWGEDEDEIPEEYVIQCAHNAEIVRANLETFLPVFMPVLIGGQKWKVFQPVTEHRPELVEDLMALEADFWLDVVEGNAPPAEGDDRGKKALSRLYPADSGEELVVEAHEELHQLAVDLAEAKTFAKEATEHQTGAENKIKERMGNLSALLGTGWKITWKLTKDSEKTDWQAVAKAFEGMIPADHWEKTVQLHTTVKPGYRRFNTNFKGLEAE